MSMVISTFVKIPIAVQTVIGFALTVVGVWLMLNSTAIAEGDPKMLLLFCSIGVVYLYLGVPNLLEGAMTMVYKPKDKVE